MQNPLDTDDSTDKVRGGVASVILMLTVHCHLLLSPDKDNNDDALTLRSSVSLEHYLDHMSLGLYLYKWHKVYSLSGLRLHHDDE